MLKTFTSLIFYSAVFGSIIKAAPAELTVRVSDAQSGAPISSATVSLLARGKLIAEVETADDGLAKFAESEPSSYLVHVSSRGYRDLLDPADAGHIFTFRTPSQLQFAVALTRTAAVSGSILKRDGQAAVGVQVVALARHATSAGVRLVSDTAIPPTVTDERGAYRLYNLLPGTYTIAAIPSSNGSANEDTPAPSFFPGTVVPTNSEFFDLHAGDERNGIVFALPDQQTHELNGQILGIPASWNGDHTFVTLFSKGAFRTPIATATSDAKGHFSFPAVPAGDYQLTAFGPESSLNQDFPTTVDERSASLSVSVGPADQTVELTLQDLPNLAGELVFKDGASPAVCGAIDRVAFHPEDGWLDVLSPLRFSPPIKQPTSRFQLKAIPAGQYTLELPGLAEPCHLAQVIIGAQQTQPSSSTQLLNRSTSIKLLVSAANGSISGTIVGGGEHPNGVVLLVTEKGGDPSLSVPIDAAARFQFNNVPPGQYTLAARHTLASSSDLDAATIDRSNSTTITVEAGRQTVITLKMGI